MCRGTENSSGDPETPGMEPRLVAEYTESDHLWKDELWLIWSQGLPSG